MMCFTIVNTQHLLPQETKWPLPASRPTTVLPLQRHFFVLQLKYHPHTMTDINWCNCHPSDWVQMVACMYYGGWDKWQVSFLSVSLSLTIWHNYVDLLPWSGRVIHRGTPLAWLGNGEFTDWTTFCWSRHLW